MELKHIKADGTYKKEIINEEKRFVISLSPIKYLEEILDF